MKITEKDLNQIAVDFYDAIYKYCHQRVRNDHDAYDLTQDVFLALSQSYERIEYSSCRQWLYQTAHNMVVDYYKSIRRDNERVVSIEATTKDSLSFNVDFLEQITTDDTASHMDVVLSHLRSKEKRLYEEVYVKKKDYHDLAKEYGISETTLRKRVSRLGRKIRKLIQVLLFLYHIW